MSLRLICGRAGTGKSEFCYKEIAQKINKEKNKKIYIITPEQFSLTTEKKLLEQLNSKAVTKAEVLSFKRMAYRISTEVEGKTNIELSPSGKAMLLYQILLENKNKLKFLGKSEKNIELLDKELTELKKHNVSIEMLEKCYEEEQDEYRKAKIKDILLIYKRYEEILQDSYIDENDNLSLLLQRLEKSKMFENTEIYLDEFVGFTKQEYSLIEKLLTLTDRISVTITTDNLDMMTNRDTDVFYSNKQTADKLLYLAKKQEIPLEKTIFLQENYRLKNRELTHLENNLYKIPMDTYKEEPQNIKLFLASNPYSEIENVAKQITKLIKEEKYKYKEIGIITKRLDCYGKLCKVILEMYGIPTFIDEKKDVSQNSLIKYVLSILDIFSKNWSYESMFNYIKTSFLQDIDYEEICMLENYCVQWGIKGNKWYQGEWNFEEINEKNREKLEIIKQTRKKIVDPLFKLKQNLIGIKTVKQITKNLYQFLIENNIPQILEEKRKQQQEQGNLEIAKDYETAWNVIMSVFDELVMIFGENKVTFEKYMELLKIGLSDTGLGKIPATQDEVIVGDIDRTRSHKMRAIFMIGLNDGSFPEIHKNEGFFNDSDREYLKQKGIELAKGTTESLYEDNFNIYKAFTTSEEKLYLSYPSSNLDGGALRPSIFITKLKKIFPKIKEESDIVSKNYELLNEKVTFEELIENLRNLKEEGNMPNMWYNVYQYFRNSPKWNEKLKASLEAIQYTNLPHNLSKENVDKLYGNTMQTSVSKLEQYRECPYSFFLQYGLKLSEKNNFKVQAIDTGNFMHEVIDEFFDSVQEQKIEIKEITEEQIKEIIHNIIKDKLQLTKNYIFTSNKKYQILVIRLERLLNKSMKYIVESLNNSDFKVYANEMEFKKGKDYEPIIIDAENGKKVELIGKIDRIDVAKINSEKEEKYIRIIDYKSSVKDIDFNEVYAGVQLQLLTYLDATCKIEEMLPAGVLYFNLIDPIIKADKLMSEEEIENKIKENFKMRGIILADVKVAKMMDKTLETGKSKVIPAYIDKEGNLSMKMSNAVTKEQFEDLQKYTLNVIEKIANEMLRGDISLNPTYHIKTKRTSCDFCKYKSICNFKNGSCNNHYKYIANKSKEEILKKIRES